MRFVTIRHPDLGRAVSVPASTARVLARSGWVEDTDPAGDPGENRPDEGHPTHLPDPGDDTSLTEED